MRTTSYLLPALLLTACGSMQETAQVRDDVYDIPDRTVVASVDPVPEAPAGTDDYYNADQATQYQQGSYYDRTYGDPSWYNRDRFGFGFNSGPWGQTWGMSYGMGWGNSTWFNSPTGWYNPYWSNSWQSGYGYYSPWNGGMYDPWYSGYGGWGCGYNWGWNSPYGWGNNWGWNNGFGYGSSYYGSGFGYPYAGYGYGGWGGWNEGHSHNLIIAPRPGMGGGGAAGGANVNVVPRSARGDRGISLLRPPGVRERTSATPTDRARPSSWDRGRVTSDPGTYSRDRSQPERKERGTDRPARVRERSRDTAPQLERGGGNGGGGHSGGGSRGGGGGSTPSPRPRR